MQENRAVNQWLEINKRAIFHKRLNAGLVILLIIQTCLIFYLITLPPSVVTIEGGKKSYHTAVRKNLALKKTDIEDFVKDFILIYNQWEDFAQDRIIKNISPLVTEGLKKKLAQTFKNSLAKELKDKNARQGVTNLKVMASKNQVIASFDKVLRVNKIPLVIPTVLSFQLIRGKATQWNKLGLYINGITRHEDN